MGLQKRKKANNKERISLLSEPSGTWNYSDVMKYFGFSYGKANNIIREIEYKKISADGYIPDMYATESNKFEIYKWIDSCKNIDELQRIWSKIKDIYGKIPSELNNVLKLRKIKIIFTVFANSFMKYYFISTISCGSIMSRTSSI